MDFETKPTLEAERYFRTARTNFMYMHFQDKDMEQRVQDLTTGLALMCGGLMHLSTGVRATYILLQQVQAQLQRSRV